jgi:hypothetical protein
MLLPLQIPWCQFAFMFATKEFHHFEFWGAGLSGEQRPLRRAEVSDARTSLPLRYPK